MPDRLKRTALTFWIAGLLLILFSLSAGAIGFAARPQKGKPGLNVLLITIDTLRADRLGVYDPSHPLTPNIDRFASSGVVFTRAFAHTPTTLPSHANILLGTTPSYHGVHDNANFLVPAGLPTLAGHLKASGYSTGAFVGGFPLDSRFGLGRGFDVYDDNFSQKDRDPGIDPGRERRAQAVLDVALNWLKGRTSPWFLWIHCFDPHDPYVPPEPYRSRHAQNLYDGEVAYTDAALGTLFRHLEETGLLSATLIVLTGDHGEALGEHGEKTHGYLAYNASLRIPLIIRLPGEEHRVVSRNVSHVDILPTVCDILGLQTPAVLQGASLLPLLRGKGGEDRPIYFESLSPFFNLGWAPITGFIFKTDKFIDSPIPELYDLGKDLDERQNLAADKNLEDFRKRLAQIVRRQSSGANDKARQSMDQQTREKLMSLGYLAGRPGAGQAAFSAEDDVKTLLPLQKKSMEALELYNSGRAKEGTDALKEIITGGKRVSAAYLNLAEIYKKQGRWPEAISVLKMGLEKLPDVYDLFVQYIACLYDGGQFDETLKVFEGANYPQAESDPVIWNYIGLAYWNKGNAEKARQNYEKSMRLDKKFAVPHYNLGSLLTFQYKTTNDPATYRKAVESYERAIALDPSYAAAYHGLGVVHFQAKDYEKAIAGLKKALDLDLGLDETLYFLGVAHMMRGETVPAYQFFMKYKSSPSYARLSGTEKDRLESYIAKCKRD
jgi:arylsulfatase A-like enzyme/Tfp pilus assembly protein PilF